MIISRFALIDSHNTLSAIVADSPDEGVTFHSTDPYGHVPSTSEVSANLSAGDTGSIMGGDVDPFDFSYYMDRVS